ncbi:MAG: VWA domain-containing protein [Acidobacteria bacterium]|nr:VWA domain-containing protein [Acidobacteriota bacterium]
MDRPSIFCGALLVASLEVLACHVAAQAPPRPGASAAQQSLTTLDADHAVEHKGLFTIDVVPTDASGSPVSNLEPSAFTILDNGKPAKIRTFERSHAGSEPAPQLIFVLDALNLSPEQLAQTESTLTRFFLRNNGQTGFPTFLYWLTRDGLFSSVVSTLHGAVLVEELKEKRSQIPVWTRDLRQTPAFPQSEIARNKFSLRALGSIAIQQRDVPGHKVVVWIGPGWPVNGGEIAFNDATEFSTRLREARITLDNLNVWLDPVLFNYHDFLTAPRAQKDMQPANLSLQVIAAHTGGMVLDSSENLEQGIGRCVEDLRTFYSLTFNPPRTDTVDEYHDLRVQLSDPDAIVRAPAGYYNEPAYFDNPLPDIQKVTVAQLEQIVHKHPDLSQTLAKIELTERLSTPRLNKLLSGIHREKDRQALTIDADLSVSLQPPPDEIANRPPPELGEQRTILQRTFDYLRNVIPRLPDFYALRNTAQFQEPPERDKETWKIRRQDRTLHFATGEHASVLYRNGNEEVAQKKKIGKTPIVRTIRTRELETRGTFGPILSFVLAAAVASPASFRWERWERGKDGDLAVFTFKASGASNVPELTYCCLPTGNGTTVYRSRPDDSVEFAVNPDSGSIMRIAINADLDEDRDPDVPLIRSQITVEYGPEQLGGKIYICPRRSVEVSRARSMRLIHEWGMEFSVYSYFETMINDVSFGGYHKFGSEFRILPDYHETN